MAFDAPNEWEFARDLETFYNSAEGKEAVGQRSLYLLRNLDLSHPKLGLYKEVKTLETILAGQVREGEPPLVLNAFVLSPTKFADLLNVGDPTKKAELESRNVLFMEDGAATYLRKLFATLT